MASRRHRWRGKWHGDDAECWLLEPHWHVACRDKGCAAWWVQPVLFDPSAYDRVP